MVPELMARIVCCPRLCRVNLEYVPLLPAGAVRWVLPDPRKIPDLLVWRSERDREAKDVIRVAP
jgi:hypothetical protein